MSFAWAGHHILSISASFSLYYPFYSPSFKKKRKGKCSTPTLLGFVLVSDFSLPPSIPVSAATSSYIFIAHIAAIFAMSHDQSGSTKFSHSLVPKRVNWIVATFSFIFWSSHLLPILAWLFGSVFLLYLHFCPPSTSQDFLPSSFSPALPPFADSVFWQSAE